MKQYSINKYLPKASKIAYGCMGLGGGWNENPVTTENINQARSIIETALESGINVFDHADIYTFNKAEAAFGKALKQEPSLRERMYIQSKCGIRFEDDSAPGRYDFSADWVKKSVDGILQRLQIEKLDVLLLHRPDPLMNTEELAEALLKLRNAGKFDHLGVSNMSHHQINFLQSSLNLTVVANQVEMSLANLDWLNEGVMIGTHDENNNNYVAGMMEFCRLNDIQLQAWGSLARGIFSEKGMNSEQQHIRETSQYVMQLCEKYEVPSEVIVLMFLLRHPANIQPIIGTTNLDRIRSSMSATENSLSREEWYHLFVKARNSKLP